MRTFLIAVIAASVGFASVGSVNAAMMHKMHKMHKGHMMHMTKCKGTFMFMDKKTHKCMDATA